MKNTFLNFKNSYGLIFSVCVFVILSVMLTAGHTISKTRANMIEANKKLLLLAAKDIDDTLKLEFSTPLTYARAVVASPALRQMIENENEVKDKNAFLKELQALLEPIIEDFEYSNIYIITDKMRNFYSTKGVAREAGEHEIHVYNHFLEAKSTDDKGAKFAIHVDKDPLNEDKWTIFSSIPIKNAKGEILGVASFGMDASYAQNIITKLQASLNEQSASTDEKNYFYIRFADSNGLTQIDSEHISIKEPSMPSNLDERATVELNSSSMIAKKEIGEFGWKLETTMISNTNEVLLKFIKSNLLATFGILAFFVGLSVFVTYKKQKQLMGLSLKDGLSGILNRTGGEAQIKKALKKGTKGAFCLLDADKFKHINDTFGHGAGDDVIVYIASSLGKIARNTDVIFRLGGDEFGIFISGISSQNEARSVINRLFDEINKSCITSLRGHEFCLSVGASFVCAGDDFSALYKRADKALYESKKTAGNCLSFA